MLIMKLLSSTNLLRVVYMTEQTEQLVIRLAILARVITDMLSPDIRSSVNGNSVSRYK